MTRPRLLPHITGVSTRTIRNWSMNGLKFMDCMRPTLIRGDDLRVYIIAQRDTRKVKTRLDECYCFRCGCARQAAEGFAECVINNKRATLTAFCAVCETTMSKPIAEAIIPELARKLDLTITRR